MATQAGTIVNPTTVPVTPGTTVAGTVVPSTPTTAAAPVTQTAQPAATGGSVSISDFEFFFSYYFLLYV